MKLALLFAACCVLAAEKAVEERLWPPDHRHDAIVEQGRSQEWSCRIRIHSGGNREVSVATAWRRQPEGTGRNAPRECAVQWVGNHRISCQGSINPSTRVLLLFGALSGR
ncbi:MAG: hypothetical protein HXY18_09920 [Bryobacteraceae bacterium]|nr:hypothetical protein [Bryobacteraceae bacterium]